MQAATETPPDLIEFLSARYGTGPEPVLAALGTFLVTFKRKTPHGAPGPGATAEALVGRTTQGEQQ